LNAITHIYDGGEPPARDGYGKRNTLLGSGIHTLASLWWAAFHQIAFRTQADKVSAGAATAVLAYFVDYHVVPRRLQPGFEAHLSPRALAAVYVALALALAAGSRLRVERLRAGR